MQRKVGLIPPAFGRTCPGVEVANRRLWLRQLPNAACGPVITDSSVEFLGVIRSVEVGPPVRRLVLTGSKEQCTKGKYTASLLCVHLSKKQIGILEHSRSFASVKHFDEPKMHGTTFGKLREAEPGN